MILTNRESADWSRTSKNSLPISRTLVNAVSVYGFHKCFLLWICPSCLRNCHNVIPKAGMCGPCQPAMFYKVNRNWGLLSPSAGKLYYSEYIVSHGYNVTGNGERECTPKGCRQRQENMRQAVCGNAKRRVRSSGQNHQSAAEPLSLAFQIWKCSQSINDFESKGL